MRYVPPAQRPGRPVTTVDRVRRIVHQEEARRRSEERPFDPEAPREHYAKPHHFAVNSTATRDAIVDAMARTFWVSGWADAMEEAGERLHGELMDQAPPTNDEARELAEKAAKRIEAANGMPLNVLYDKMCEMPGRHDREPTDFDFGYCLAMMYMGSGVSWFDDHPGDEDDLKVPHGEGLWVSPDDVGYESNPSGALSFVPSGNGVFAVFQAGKRIPGGTTGSSLLGHVKQRGRSWYARREFDDAFDLGPFPSKLQAAKSLRR